MNRPLDALPHALQPYWRLTLAAVQAEALQLALAEDLFETLASPCTPEALAQMHAWQPEATRHWLTLLWSMQLLDRSRDSAGEWHYASSEVARRYLASSSALDCGDAWRVRLASLRDFGAGLADRLGGKNRPTPLAKGERWAVAARGHQAREPAAGRAPAG